MNLHTSAPPACLLSSYAADGAAFDELCAAPGQLRPHWTGVLQRLEALGLPELSRRHRESDRLLRENGVTYNVYDDPSGAWRTWSFDPIPMVLSENDWRTLETGLIERAELWDLALKDLYGPRTLIRDGVIPAALVDSDPGYLRACHSHDGIQSQFLHLCAIDVVRKADGGFLVVDDRAQAPSGSGYALENRLVVSRIFGDLYRNTQVHRLAGFFRTKLATLTRLAPADTTESADFPRMVLLTPGPGNETYFEHSYLANYLGMSLVQGSDLLVIDRKVWLRTLDGLERVHVILRRVDDTYCDPLELRSDSMLGVPGLLSAWRAGNVVVSNPLGTGICENIGLMSYLPAIAKHFLGRDLKLPAARAWWCGNEADRQEVLSRFDQVMIRSASVAAPGVRFIPSKLSTAEQNEWIQQIQARPHAFAARELAPLSQAPALVDSGMEPRGMMLRTFLVANEHSYSVMPGGLTRVSPSREVVAVSNQEGGVSKDTWVLASEPPRYVTLLPKKLTFVELQRGGGAIASRVAENLYWVGRYAERSESTARLLKSVILRLVEGRMVDDDVLPADLLRAVTHLTTSYPGFMDDDEQLLAAPDDELLSLVIDPDRHGSLRYNLDALRLSGQSARDRFSDDMWRILASVDEELPEIRYVSEAVETIGHVILKLSAIAGLVADSMTRGPGYWFVDVGRRIERTMVTINLLRACLFMPDERPDALMETLLETTDSVMTYRRRYKARLQPAGVLDLLLTDASNPRSVAFQLVRLQELFETAPGTPPVLQQRTPKQMVLESLGTIRATDVDTMEQMSEDPTVHAILEQILVKLNDTMSSISDLICSHYFVRVEPPRQLVEFQ